MHINVRDILVESVGYSRAYKISGERPEIDGLTLTRDIEGEITISRLDSSLLVRGRVMTEIELECHRCLSTFSRPTHVNLAQEYAESPMDDQLPIEDDEIDLAPVIGQELILDIPLQILCRPDCPGIQDAAEQYTKEADTSTRVAQRARITKGTKRGRT
ncbi:MAG TPA: DUF177 domain-containing protein [Candidatus Saccharimonadia bacterium]|nr:DUF177 domain-containing protein [Candidatus Saccharimonadia bacterium]